MATQKKELPKVPKNYKEWTTITLVKDLKKQKAGAKIRVSVSTAAILKKKGYVK